MFTWITSSSPNKKIIATLIVMLVSLLFSAYQPKLSAAELTNRSISIGSSAADAITPHTYTFTINNGISFGSLEVEYCTNSPFIGDACSAPVGFSLASSSMGAQTGVSGFSIHPNTTVNKLVLGRAPAGIVPPTSVSIRINNINNPSGPNETVFVRMSTFATNDGTGIRGDTGTVVFSVVKQVSVSGFVPPYLTFCSGVTVNGNCTATQGNYLDFGEFSKTQPKVVTSQFAVATNDPTGYITTMTGITLTAGSYTIPALAVPTASVPGTSQFGMNLRTNPALGVGADKTGVGTGNPAGGYNTPNFYLFAPGALASSVIPTEFNVFTVTYIANISPDQHPGVYSSTITYITTVSF